MNKRVLITGSTDGIGLETAKMMIKAGYDVLLHGRNALKLEHVTKQLKKDYPKAFIDAYLADLSHLKASVDLASAVKEKYDRLDVLINNAGVYVVNHAMTEDGLDVRFAVNTIAPYLLYKGLASIMGKDSRVVNLSSAAQASVDLDAMISGSLMNDSQAYAQSKLALTMWSMELGQSNRDKGEGASIIAVNPKSFLGSKMVREAYGRQGYDLGIGADIIMRAAVADEFEDASGKYYDNDLQAFSNPHSDALDRKKRKALVATIESIIE